MSQTKAAASVERILALVQEIRQDENPKPFSNLSAKLDWIAFHARQIETKCEGCVDSPSGSQK